MGWPRQRLFAPFERRLRLERRFKQLILLATMLVVGLILGLAPWGRYLAESIVGAANQAGRQAVGLPKSREEIDASWLRFRRMQIDRTRPRIETFFAEAEPGYQRLMRYAGMDPEHALLRWANYDWTILLSSKVFEADDSGRSFRLRPRTRSIWLRKVDEKIRTGAGITLFFLIPDGPGLAEAVRGTSATVVEGSRQTTNSWGLRGPEPELDAPLRGLVLGDSFMQGMFVGDDDTPPECLRRNLQARFQTRVSILNAGVMGYSPEQYYYTLIALADRFRPHFVVVSVFPNDFGGASAVASRGDGDWPEGKYWLEKIVSFCRERRWPCLIVPAPYEAHLFTRRASGYYPGMLLNILDSDSMSILDPFDAFVNAHLRAVAASRRCGRPVVGSPLYNNTLMDDHFSAAGARVWAEAVGERILLLLDRESDDDGDPGIVPPPRRSSSRGERETRKSAS